jgi:lipopolysaccharide export system protein LptA
MRTSQAARYARWAATVAVVLTVTVSAVYLRRSWQAVQSRKQAPPAVPPTVQQRSAVFSFSKVEQERTLFTVRASHATEFKEGNRNLLEDVWITIYGRTAQRFDNMHTKSCDYLEDTGRIVCAGDVQMDLESAAEASEHPGERAIRVSTSNVAFDRDSGNARTDRPVSFRFPYGQGRGVGLTYSSHAGLIRLQRDVELTLAQAPGAEPVRVAGSSLEYRRETRTLRLLAPVRATQGHRELTAGELALELDAELRAQRLIASRQPELRSAEPRGQAVLSADEFLVFFGKEGWTERIVAAGNVRGRRTDATGEDGVTSERAEVEMLPRLNQPHLLTASGGVVAESSHRGASRRLETAALRLFFAAAGPAKNLAGAARGRRLDRAETLAPATMEWQGPSTVDGKRVTQSTRLQAQQAAAEFGARNQLRTLTGSNGVETERQLPGRPTQVTSSRELLATFGAGSEWTEIEQTGHVRFREGDRAGQADRAHLVRSSDSVALRGSVVLTDLQTRTTAQSAFFNQRTGEVRAEGDVRSTDLAPGRNSVANLAPQPAHISSDRLLANSSTGRAVYSSGARLWQGDSLIEADSIELVRDMHLLIARGNVRAVFPQTAGSSNGLPGKSPGEKKSAGPAQPAAPELWRVRAGALTYWNAEGRARLEQNVEAQSSRALITSRALELFFSSSGGPGEAPGQSGSQQLTRAVAAGGVTVREGERRGTAERGEYTAADGKFVLSGGRPTLYDASRGTTTGRQLTFFFADDKIIVDSEEGSRTLTRHRVEK